MSALRPPKSSTQPGEALADRLGPHQLALVEHDRGEQRDDADHRTDLDRDGGAVRCDELVVVEPFVVVPHAGRVHGPADRGEVLEELEHQIRRRAMAGAV